MAQSPLSKQPAISDQLHRWLGDTLLKLSLTTADSTAETYSASSDEQITLKALQAEASFRQFYRVLGATRPLVLMDSPPAKENNRQFVAVAKAFQSSGIKVPEVLAHEEDQGWLLLTDLGSTHFIDAYKEGMATHCLNGAIQTLAQISAVDAPCIPDYTSERLSDELNIFIEWTIAKACDVAFPEHLFEGVRNTLLDNAADQQKVCVHRDFHCKNLLYSDTAIGVLDFQDALRGPAGYDLASLLHDCYWQFSDADINQVLRNLPESMPPITRRAIDLLAVQRQLKALGIFTRLALRDGKISHLSYIEPVLERLGRLCYNYPECRALGVWLKDELTEPALAWVVKTKSNHHLTAAQ